MMVRLKQQARKFFYSMTRSNLAAYVTYSLLAYIVIMDICLYIELLVDGDENALAKGEISVKKLMVGQLSFYVRAPLAFFLEDFFSLSVNLPWLTADLISFTHVLLSIISVRYLINESLEWRQFGCILFHIRNFLDSLDGIIYRAQNKQVNFKSNYGTFGYMVDAVSDTIGGVCLTISILVLLYKLRPVLTRNHTRCSSMSDRFRACIDSIDSKLLPPESSGDAQTNGGYSLVIEMNDVDHNRKLNTRSSSNSVIPASRLYVIVGVALLGIRLAASGFFWDRSVRAYSDLLESANMTDVQKQIQVSYLSSSFTLFIMFAWRYMCAISLLDIILSAIFLDKIWEFIEKTKFISWMLLFGLVILTEFNTLYISSHIHNSK